ncbi:hypothetical protein P4493_05910 [Bacillus thuringiensis]|jgi:hypothetical protein|uniref:Uncharacterized protein n=3 Tax=Bacillus thuringiensis TaxID=1428 RepID=A0A0B5NCB1_BACTU|nr:MULTISPECIES: hypothetical protein [Bacillus]EAO55633.1 hypothetical protein RBTH_06769 [Bacillus thuringiensis serovar israelensis ATCC 35646]MEC2533098.1 hypothetical protein [Bacillus cereus]MED1153922.1 hypothetical protein [Bacillus paranthracis]OUB09237.1 hypothetical protein BK708_32395 [Bacillus thuringiensis serovar yunnanensis]AFQ29794.1 hypothetical protein BTF1_28467 [Bacillus thuringiensis HD-789]
MKQIVREDILDFQLGKLPWNKMFENESELIHALTLVNYEDYKGRGYENPKLVKDFQSRLACGLPLSVSQVLQLKRIAKDIYTYVSKECVG